MKLVADFSSRWERLEKTYGYKSARIKVPYKFGADFWVHLHLIAQPSTTSEWASLPPDIEFEEKGGDFFYEIKGKILTIVVPLNNRSLWRHAKDRATPLLFVDRTGPDCLCGWTNDVYLDLRVWITSEAETVPVPDKFERGVSKCVSGGQFESNRARH